MTPRSGTRVAVCALAVVSIIVTACGSGDPIVRATGAVVTAPPNVSLTSYGAQFLTTCTFSHTLMDDPIVHPGVPNASHQHEFFGNVDTNAKSTFASLVDDDSTCNDDGDRSAYWVPTLTVDGKRVEPNRIDAYYRVAAGVDPTTVRVYPNGLKAIAGDQHSTTTPSLQVAAWTCGLSTDLVHEPPKTCTPDRPVALRLTFPSCWDGAHLESADFKSHLAYPTSEGCPGSHPVPLAQLTLVVHYPLTGTFTHASLASGDFNTTHGDFFEAWQPTRIRDQVTGCLNRKVTCSIVGGTFHTGQGSGDTDSYNFPDSPERPATRPSVDAQASAMPQP